MGQLVNQFKELWNPLGANQKISLILAAGLVALAMIAMMIWAAQPNLQLLYGNLPPEEAGEIISKLEQKGVKFDLGKSGGDIYVEASMVHRLRAELATDGVLPSGSGPGFELFDQGGFGISDFHQRTNFLRAVQGELARTIMQFDGVNAARVMVVMPENRIIVSKENRDKPKASVFVDTSNGLPIQAVNAIRHLVANAIQGLDVNDVAVLDKSGLVLTAELQGDGLSGGLTSDVIRLRKKYESDFTTKVQTMLDRVLGSGQSVVRVAVDIDTSSVQTTEKSYDPESAVVRQSTVEENSTIERESDSSPTVAGVSANVPNEAGANGAGNSKDKQERNEVKTEQFEISERVTDRLQQPGQISRITASLLVAKQFVGAGEERREVPRTPEQLDELRNIVINALGIKVQPGERIDDFVTVKEMEFAGDALLSPLGDMQEEVEWQKWIEMGKNAVGVVLGLGLILFFMRMLKRNQPEQISVEVLQPEQMLHTRKLEDTSSVTPEMLNELIRQKPANIGVTLKDWIGEAGSK